MLTPWIVDSLKSLFGDIEFPQRKAGRQVTFLLPATIDETRIHIFRGQIGGHPEIEDAELSTRSVLWSPGKYQFKIEPRAEADRKWLEDAVRITARTILGDVAMRWLHGILLVDEPDECSWTMGRDFHVAASRIPDVEDVGFSRAE